MKVIIGFVSKDSFFPKPKVDSAIVRITPVPPKERPLNQKQEKLFKQIVKAGFSQKRKQLKNNLKTGLSLSSEQVEVWLKQSKTAPSIRAEDISIETWISLTKTYPQA